MSLKIAVGCCYEFNKVLDLSKEWQSRGTSQDQIRCKCFKPTLDSLSWAMSLLALTIMFSCGPRPCLWQQMHRKQKVRFHTIWIAKMALLLWWEKPSPPTPLRQKSVWENIKGTQRWSIITLREWGMWIVTIPVPSCEPDPSLDVLGQYTNKTELEKFPLQWWKENWDAKKQMIVSVLSEHILKHYSDID